MNASFGLAALGLAAFRPATVRLLKALVRLWARVRAVVRRALVLLRMGTGRSERCMHWMKCADPFIIYALAVVSVLDVGQENESEANSQPNG